jgi:FkbM family methyltransferase
MASSLFSKDAVRSVARRVTRVHTFSDAFRVITRAGLVSDGIWKRLPVERSFVVKTAQSGPFSYTSCAGDQIGRSLFWKDLSAWEAETCEVFEKLCAHANLVVDVGANTGAYTLPACAASSNARVISFEPVPAIYRRLACNVEDNGWSHRWQGYQCACSDGAETSGAFHIPYGELPSSACLDPNGFRGAAGTVVTVVLRTVDSVVPGGTRVDVVKIDVEGFEDRVLNGMRRILGESAPAIVVECNPDGPFRSVEAILSGFGYRFYHLRSAGPARVEHIVPNLASDSRNYLCLAREGALPLV